MLDLMLQLLTPCKNIFKKIDAVLEKLTKQDFISALKTEMV